jgi:hypothetical protein
MDDTRDADRWMLLAGPLFTVLAVVAALLQGSTPGEKASAKEVVNHFNGHQGATLTSVFLWGPAAALLLVFVSRLRAGIDDRARAARSLLVAGGVLYATSFVVSASITLGLVSSSDENFGQVAQTLNVLSNDLWIPMVIGIAAMLFGAGLAVLRTGLLPVWLGWVAVVVGVLSILGPGGFLGYFLAPLWIAVAGLMLYLRRPDAVAATA